MFNGALTALATPFRDGEVDEQALREMVEWQIQSGIDGLVPCGSTGESATLTHAEHERVVAIVIDQTRRRVPVVAGAGSNSTAEAIRLTASAREAGADGALLISPYYNKPTQEGLYRHFKAIAEAVDLPLILYNVPGRTVADLSNDTALRLAQIPNVVGIKDATADLYRASDLFSRAPAGFACYTGDDGTAAAFLLMGGHGVVSVTANVVPSAMAALCRAALAGDTAAVRRINDPLLALHRDLFVEANPIPVKWALAELGRIGPGLRLPLTPLSSAHHETVRRALREAGAI